MNLLYFLDLTGTAAFAISGALAGIQRKMDLLGVLVLGMVTAIGGGTLRDMLLGATPPFCFENETYLYISLGFSLLTFFTHRHLSRYHDALLYFDAVGLATFVVLGTAKALAYDCGVLSSIILGVITATAGGVIRDVLSNQVPLILHKEVYASACIAGGLLFAILKIQAFNHNFATVLAATTVIALRLLAIRHKWALPTAKID